MLLCESRIDTEAPIETKFPGRAEITLLWPTSVSQRETSEHQRPLSSAPEPQPNAPGHKHRSGAGTGMAGVVGSEGVGVVEGGGCALHL